MTNGHSDATPLSAGQKGSHGIVVPRHPPPDVISVLRDFVNGIYGYMETGVWPDNHTLRTWAEKGKDALDGIGKFIEPTGTTADSVGPGNEAAADQVLEKWTWQGLIDLVTQVDGHQKVVDLHNDQLDAVRSKLEQAREALRKYDFAPWKPPFRYDDLGSQILDSENRMIVDVRGWGFLTGAGGAALKLHEEDARDIQDRLGEHVTKLLNLTSVGQGTVAGGPPVNPESDLVSSLREVIEQKDEALRGIIAADSQGWSQSHKAVVMRARAICALAAASPKALDKKETCKCGHANLDHTEESCEVDNCQCSHFELQNFGNPNNPMESRT